MFILSKQIPIKSSFNIMGVEQSGELVSKNTVLQYVSNYTTRGDIVVAFGAIKVSMICPADKTIIIVACSEPEQNLTNILDVPKTYNMYNCKMDKFGDCFVVCSELGWIYLSKIFVIS